MPLQLRDALKEITSPKLISGVAVLVAYCLLDPLINDIQDTIGKPILYHPIAIWVCLILLIYSQTQSLATGVAIVFIYEAFKIVWRQFRPEPPMIGQLRKLLHRLQAGIPLSDSDVAFLDSITPNNVTVAKK